MITEIQMRSRHVVAQPITADATCRRCVKPPSDPAVPLDLIDRTVGEFHILKKLGQGGMGAVYLAEQRSLKRKVALKFLRPELTANETAMHRFRKEAESVAR